MRLAAGREGRVLKELAVLLSGEGGGGEGLEEHLERKETSEW